MNIPSSISILFCRFKGSTSGRASTCIKVTPNNDVSIDQGKSTTFTCRLSDPVKEIRWEARPLFSGPSNQTNFKVVHRCNANSTAGITECRYTLDNTKTDDSKAYTCCAANQCCRGKAVSLFVKCK